MQLSRRETSNRLGPRDRTQKEKDEKLLTLVSR